MNKLMQGIECFWREEEGTEVVEWALVGGLIVAVGAAIFAVIGQQTGIALGNLSSLVTEAATESSTAAP